MASVAAPLVVTPAAAEAQGCSTVTLIGARGSGEPLAKGTDDVGPAVDDMARSFRMDFRSHGSVAIQGDTYPADPISDLEPSATDVREAEQGEGSLALINYTLGVAKYFASIQAGISDAVAEAKAAVQDCPTTLLVLAGYSQGAMVMHQAELKLEDSHDTAVLQRIAGTLLLADGDRVPHTQATEFGTSAHNGQGIRPYMHLITPRDVPFPATTADICDAGDFVCDFGLSRIPGWSRGFAIHTSYATQETGLLAQAALWLSNKMKAGPGNIKVYVYLHSCTPANPASTGPPACTDSPFPGVSVTPLRPVPCTAASCSNPVATAQRCPTPTMLTNTSGVATFTGCASGYWEQPLIQKAGYFEMLPQWAIGFVKGAETTSVTLWMAPDGQPAGVPIATAGGA
jgi:hypothetical protein